VAWHYLLYSSMSLALTFLGFMCLTRSAALQGWSCPLRSTSIAARRCPLAGDSWQRLGLALILFGLGSKLGLAPLYSWLPETYEAAPTSTSALLAAVQFNISVVAVFRVLQVFRGEIGFVAHELLVMGCLSLTVAAVQVMAARNYKRLIAYACVSSSGVIAIGPVGGQGGGLWRGAVCRQQCLREGAAVPHRPAAAGGVRHQRGGGAQRRDPRAAVLRPAVRGGHLRAAGLPAVRQLPGRDADPVGHRAGRQPDGLYAMMCTMLTIIFVATGRVDLPDAVGPVRAPGAGRRRVLGHGLPKLGFVSVLVLLGAYTPGADHVLLLAVAQSIGGQ
jgi:hydrogenase-4 component F